MKPVAARQIAWADAVSPRGWVPVAFDEVDAAVG